MTEAEDDDLGRTFHSIEEATPGEKWQRLHDWFWPSYKQWYLREGNRARPSYLDAVTAFRKHMPELVPVFEQLVDLAGGGDLVSRFLTLYCPAPYAAGCSQVAWLHPEPTLIRNYDYRPDLWEAVALRTEWLQPVICSSDCLWGALDGVNAGGLTVSLAFGGRRAIGKGFGMPIILRYILETCTRTAAAVACLERLPTHMPYNVTVMDRHGDHATVQCAPDRNPLVSQTRVATNHQGKVTWPEHAEATGSVEREEFLLELCKDRKLPANEVETLFHEPPLHSTEYRKSRGTLYTVSLQANSRRATWSWPSQRVQLDLDRFEETEIELEFE